LCGNSYPYYQDKKKLFFADAFPCSKEPKKQTKVVKIMLTIVHLSSGEKVILRGSAKEILGNISEAGIEEGYSEYKVYNEKNEKDEKVIIFHSHITHIRSYTE